MYRLVVGAVAVGAAVFFARLAQDVGGGLGISDQLIYGSIAGFTIIILYWITNNDNRTPGQARGPPGT